MTEGPQHGIPLVDGLWTHIHTHTHTHTHAHTHISAMLNMPHIQHPASSSRAQKRCAWGLQQVCYAMNHANAENAARNMSAMSACLLRFACV